MSCEHCTQGYILPGEPAGTMSELGGIKAYYHGGSSKSRAVVLLTDAFGLPLKNCKIMADDLSKRLDSDVWVPDLFNGNPVMPVGYLDGIMPDRAGVGIRFMGYVKFVFKLLRVLPQLIANRSSVVDARVDSFMLKLKEEKKYEKIGTVGYCFGGSVAIRLGSKSLFDSIVICHPGSCSIEDIKQINVPTAWACAEEDMSFNPKLRNEAEAVFQARKDKPDFVDYEFTDYKGTVHGFAARPMLSDPEIKEAFEKAFDQTVKWFEKTL